jgi:hypothetical protein
MQSTFRALRGLLILSSLAAAAPAPRPYLAPWLKVTPGDARIVSLQSAPAASLSPNAPGLLLEINPEGWAGSRPAALEAIRLLARDARRSGWRWGMALLLPEAPVPLDARAAEAATIGSLYPGLDALVGEASGADLVTLTLETTPALDSKARSFLLRKTAAGVRAAAPSAQVAFVLGRLPAAGLFGSDVKDLLSEESAAYLDLVGVRPSSSAAPATGQIRLAVDDVAFGKPAFVDLDAGPPAPDPRQLLAAAARVAPEAVPFTAMTPSWDPSKDAVLSRLARLLDGDFGNDTRGAFASAGGKPLAVYRLVSGTDLGGIVVIPGVGAPGLAATGTFTLTLDETSYASAEVLELATGRSTRFEIPPGVHPARLSLALASTPLAVKLAAREKAPSEAAKAAVGVAETRGLSAEEILARHQAWRAGRDARWSRLSARNAMSIRFRFANLGNTLELGLAGAFFYEKGRGYDWVWTESTFNGVRWKGKKTPELPLVQPEKVSEMPLALTFDDAYKYTLTGEEAAGGVRCYALDFEPRARASDKPLFAGTVWIAKGDFAVMRTKTRQLNLSGEIQAVDEVSDFGEVAASDGGPPMRFPTHTKGQWILKTFSTTTVVERETVLSEVRLDPPSFEADRAAAFASKETMVRDTEKGVRYLEKLKTGERIVTEDTKRGHLFGLAGVFYDSSFDYPLPLLGIYYIDLDFRKKQEQVQVFFGGVLLAASYNQPRLFGTTIDAGVDVFGIAIRGSDALFVDGTEDKTQRVKSRSFLFNLKAGVPAGRHIKLSATFGETHRDFAADTETSPAFAIPSDHWVTRLEGQAIWDYEGWALSGRWGWNKRSRWDAWGLPGNPDYDPGKDTFQTWGFQLAKDFHLPRFQRIRTSLGFLGSSNTDRFSEYTFGSFGGTSLRGFRSGALRAEQAITSKIAYGYVFGDTFRLEAIYEDARVKDNAAGYDWAYFGGAGLGGELPGPWSTLVRFDFGIPVAGRSRGQTGFVLNLTFLKIF